MRRRLDVELVRRRVVGSRQEALEAVSAGRVLVAGVLADKPARLVAAGEPLALVAPVRRFVSRGGDKLDAALDRFRVAVVGQVCLDAGASTGGFTDCLLQRGAESVVAVDVGHGQLHERLRADQRVEVIERTNVRGLGPVDLGDRRFPVIVADLSFISLLTVAPALLSLARPGASLVVLVKPQFEAGKASASRGRGVVSDPEVWRVAVAKVLDGFAGLGADTRDVMASPLTGAEGNVEFLAHLVLGDEPRFERTDDASERASLIDAAVESGRRLSAHEALPRDRVLPG